MEANLIKDSIVVQILDVSNLVGTAFLNSNGNITKAPVSSPLKDRTEDLSFVRVSCIVDKSVVDSRIVQCPFRTHFCLKLP